MSQNGGCFDNPAMGSWNHSFKVETIHGERFDTREMAKAAVFEYIEIYYNRLSVPAPKSIAPLVTQHIVNRLLFFQHITHQRFQECPYVSTRRNQLGWPWRDLDAPRNGNRHGLIKAIIDSHGQYVFFSASIYIFLLDFVESGQLLLSLLRPDIIRNTKQRKYMEFPMATQIKQNIEHLVWWRNLNRQSFCWIVHRIQDIDDMFSRMNGPG